MIISQKSISLQLPVIVIIAGMIGCSKSPRREEITSNRGEKHVIVRSPLNNDNGPLEIVHVRDIDGSDFPFEPGIWRISDLCVDDKGHIYLADSGHNHIVVLNTLGEYIRNIGGKGPGPSEFHTSIGPLAINWIPNSDVIVAYEPFRTVLFNAAGSPYGREQTRLRIPSLAATSNSFITCFPSQKPLVEIDVSLEELRQFARPFEPDDSPWPEARDELGEGDVQYRIQQAGPPAARLPYVFESVKDSLVIHEVRYRNSFRCWDRLTGEFHWQIDLEIEDFEPPTFYTYLTSGANDFLSWRKGGPYMVELRSLPVDMCWTDGYLFISVLHQGMGRRRKPNIMTVSSPATADEELNKGWMTRGSIEVISLEPDMIGHIPLDIQSPFWLTITPDHLLVIGTNDPEPHLGVYQIKGLW